MRRKKSVMKEWGLCYAIVFLIPLLTIFINYRYNIRLIQKEVLQAHELILTNVGDSIDRLMDEERKMFLSFYMNERIDGIASSQTTDAAFHYNAYKLKTELASYVGGDKNMSYWLYDKQKDYIINNAAAHQSLSIYNSQAYLNPEIPEYDTWIKFLRKEYSSEYMFYDGLNTSEKSSKLVYATSCVYHNTGKVNVFITIPTTAIEEQVRTLPKGSLLTIFLDGKTEDTAKKILVIDSEGIAELPAVVTEEEISKSRSAFNADDYMGISISSANKKATYSLLVPRETFWEDASYIRNVHLVSFFITLIIGIGLMIFFVKRNYRPVSSILSVLEGRNEKDNEFDQIQNAYNLMWQEKSSMKETIELQSKNIASSYLLSLLKGRAAKIGDREQQIGLGLSFESGVFALVGFFIPQNKSSDIRFDELSFFAVDNVLSELMEQDKFYRIEDGRYNFYLFCIPEEHEREWKEKIHEKATFLCDFLEDRLDLSVIMAISTVEKSIDQAKYLYQSVMEAFEYKSIIGGSGVITTEELQNSDETNSLHVSLVMLEDALERSQLDDAYLASKHLFSTLGQMPFAAVRLGVLEAFQSVVNIYNKCITDSVKRMQLLSWLEQLLYADNAVMMKQRFDEMLAFACSKISGQWAIEGQSLVQTVKEYVESNYTDSNLNVSSIAEKLNRNPKYISKVFKEETGDGILDYINSLRISKAQQLLLTRKISVESISEMVGYASTRTFRRSFTKIVGATPSEYLARN